MALGFGVSALAWCAVLFMVSYEQRDWEELYLLMGVVMWLFGNFWWMCGETTIYGDDDINSPQASYIMEAGLAWILLFHLVLLPFGFIKENKEVTEQYERAELYAPFSVLQNWRQYEYLHTVCWLVKDISWNRDYLVTWAIAIVPTIAIAFDFIWKTYQKNYILDCAHYTAQFIWVLANIMWASDEFGLFVDDDNPYSLENSEQGQDSGRWWAAVLCVLAFVPILLMYTVWIPWVLYNANKEGLDWKIKDVRVVENIMADSRELDDEKKNSKAICNPMIF